MKCRVTKGAKVEFKPIELKLTIESEDDVKNLYHRLGMLHSLVKESGLSEVGLPSCDSMGDAWSVISDLAFKLGLNIDF